MSDIYHKITHYCAYQERCEKEVREKLSKLEVSGEDMEQYVQLLKEENYLNNKRYAYLFASNKFRLKKWGRQKISFELKKKDIPPQMIQKAIAEEIEMEDYWAMATQLIEKKQASLKDKDPYKRKQKVIRYMVQKGYEMPIVLELLA